MKTKSVILAILFTVLIPMTAFALVMTYDTLPTQTVGGMPVDVTVTFTTSLNTITITADNDIVNPTSVIQNLSGIAFVTSIGSTSGSLTGGTTRTQFVDGDGSFQTSAAVPTSTYWELQTNYLGGLLLYATMPDGTLIGEPLSGNYSAANGSIAGNGPHNPFTYGTTTFTLTASGVTADTSIYGPITLFFGTSGDSVSVGVPEPGTMLLLGFGLIGLAAGARRFKK